MAVFVFTVVVLHWYLSTRNFGTRQKKNCAHFICNFRYVRVQNNEKKKRYGRTHRSYMENPSVNLPGAINPIIHQTSATKNQIKIERSVRIRLSLSFKLMSFQKIFDWKLKERKLKQVLWQWTKQKDKKKIRSTYVTVQFDPYNLKIYMFFCVYVSAFQNFVWGGKKQMFGYFFVGLTKICYRKNHIRT